VREGYTVLFDSSHIHEYTLTHNSDPKPGCQVEMLVLDFILWVVLRMPLTWMIFRVLLVPWHSLTLVHAG